jgi:hypothetical protein
MSLHTAASARLARLSRPALALAAAFAGLALSGAGAASAQAALISTSACDNSALTSPFARWGDSSSYKLAPGGDFESGAAGWTLAGGARTVAGSEPFAATGHAGASSLYLPAGASATSPFTCVNAAYPTFRFFARDDAPLATVAVSVVYKTALGLTVSVPVGVATLSSGWSPTLKMLTASAVTGALAGGTTQVALRFTALLGPSQIDDVYVDPRLC